MLKVMTVARELAGGVLTSEALIEQCLARAGDLDGEGSRVFTRIYAEQARVEARAVDARRLAGQLLPALAGLPITVKDLADVAGTTTCAGSRVLAGEPVAPVDAPAVARLRQAGLIIVGRTNMTEFAYSGLGINPHYGTPRNPFDRDSSRIPGGSSSGAAVAVTDAMAVASLGTDTGGSCRIPAALCGLVGFKPTAARVPREGIYPLSHSLDSVGPLAADVEGCAVIDGVLSGTAAIAPAPASLAGKRLLVPDDVVLDALDESVAAAFDQSLVVLRSAGAIIIEEHLPLLSDIARLNSSGGLAAAEAWTVHRQRLSNSAQLYDPRVVSRIKAGGDLSAADYIDLCEARAELRLRFQAASANFDAVLCPTVPIVAPAVSDLFDDRAYRRINQLVLRNPSLFNFLDGCSISLPCHSPGLAPVGLMLGCPGHHDLSLLALARAVEAALKQDYL